MADVPNGADPPPLASDEHLSEVLKQIAVDTRARLTDSGTRHPQSQFRLAILYCLFFTILLALEFQSHLLNGETVWHASIVTLALLGGMIGGLVVLLVTVGVVIVLVAAWQNVRGVGRLVAATVVALLVVALLWVPIIACYQYVSTERGEHGKPRRSVSTMELSTADAAELAATLANDEGERLYERRPFTSSTYSAALDGQRYRWGRLDPAPTDGLSAEVSFSASGSDPEVAVYMSSDIGFVE